MAACLQRALYLKSCLFLWVSTYELYSSTSLHAHRRILMSSSKYNMLKVTWKIYTSGKVTCFLHGRPPECRVAAVIKKKERRRGDINSSPFRVFLFSFFFFVVSCLVRLGLFLSPLCWRFVLVPFGTLLLSPPLTYFASPVKGDGGPVRERGEEEKEVKDRLRSMSALKIISKSKVRPGRPNCPSLIVFSEGGYLRSCPCEPCLRSAAPV